MVAGSRFLRFALLTALLCVAWCAQAQAAAVKKTGYITMSDGVKLRYAVELPAAAPTLLEFQYESTYGCWKPARKMLVVGLTVT